MKTLYLTNNCNNIYVDPETDEVGKLNDEDRYGIRCVYYVEEPMHVVYQNGERKEEIDAKKGDLLVQFYDNEYNKYVLDTIRTKQWTANIKNRRKIEQKEKEEWAKRKAENELKCADPGCSDCECCGKGC